MTHTRSALGICAAALAMLAACRGADDASTNAEGPDAGTGTAAEGAAGASAAQEPPAANDSCAPDGEIAYICGLANAEDLVAVGDTGWIVASSINALGAEAGPGRMYLIEADARTARELFPGDAPDIRHDEDAYPSCPGALDLESFDTHGLALREREPGLYRLYATSHGALEAIQAFELDARADEPTIAWVGCVPLPDGVWANSVSIRADGGFVTTKFMTDPSDPEAFAKILAGEINGEVYEWRPGGAVTAIAGTELSGANGIELSPDERYIYVAAFGGREVVRYDTSVAPPSREAVPVDINPDNLRWTPTGSALLTVGSDLTSNGAGWTVYRIDADTMEATALGGADGSAALQAAATALEIGGEIFIGTYNGDRVGIMPAR